MNIWFSIAVAVLGLIGFWIAEKIIKMKQKSSPITCPIGYECDDVIRGPHANFFGVPVVNMGMWYFILVSAFFILDAFLPFTREITFVALLVTGLALVFASYLVVVQLFVVKKWCSWCLFTALAVFGIFAVTFSGYSEGFAGFLFDHRNLLLVTFGLASLVGTLVTTLHAYTFARFLKDFKITQKESRRLVMYSQTAWVALGFSFLAGVGLVLSDVYREITGASAFLVIGIILGVLAVYELIQNTLIAPRLVKIHFGDHPKFDDHEHSFQRKLSIAFAVVGILSWYMLMLFTNISWHEYMPITLVLWYFGILIVGVLVGVVFESIMYRRSLLVKE